MASERVGDELPMPTHPPAAGERGAGGPGAGAPHPSFQPLRAEAAEAVRSLTTLLWFVLWGDQRSFGPTALTGGRTWLRRVAAILGSALLVAGLFALAYSEGLDGPYRSAANASLVAGAVAALTSVPLLLMPGRPLDAWRVMTVGLATGAFGHEGPGWPWPVVSSFAYLFVLLVATWRHGRRAAIGAWSIAGALALLTLTPTQGVLTATIAVSALGLVALVGVAIGERGEARGQVRVQRATIEADAVHRAVLEERSVIARELHDVAAHHMSMIAIQAQAAQVRDPQMSQTTRAALDAIEQAARSSLAETRRLVGVLRDEVAEPGGSGAPRDPQPSLAAIVGLVAEARDSGQQVVYEATKVPDVPQAVSISAYRIVQEALSNARRHAPGSVVKVRIRVTDGALEIDVTNDAAVAS